METLGTLFFFYLHGFYMYSSQTAN
jgi:hypothetical protein